MYTIVWLLISHIQNWNILYSAQWRSHIHVYCTCTCVERSVCWHDYTCRLACSTSQLYTCHVNIHVVKTCVPVEAFIHYAYVSTLHIIYIHVHIHVFKVGKVKEIMFGYRYMYFVHTSMHVRIWVSVILVITGNVHVYRLHVYSLVPFIHMYAMSLWRSTCYMYIYVTTAAWPALHYYIISLPQNQC